MPVCIYQTCVSHFVTLAGIICLDFRNVSETVTEGRDFYVSTWRRFVISYIFLDSENFEKQRTKIELLQIFCKKF